MKKSTLEYTKMKALTYPDIKIDSEINIEIRALRYGKDNDDNKKQRKHN